MEGKRAQIRPAEGKNRKQILELLRGGREQSRMEIAAHLGLTKATVTLLVNEMLREGLLEERGELPSREQKPHRGRRRVFLRVNKNCFLVFGAVIEEDHLSIGLTNLNGEVLERVRIPLEQTAYRKILEHIVDTIQQWIRADCISPEKLLALGVGLSAGGGRWVEGATPAEKLGRIKRDLSHALTLPIATATAAEGAALAQSILTAAPDHFLVLRYGTVIESAIVIDRQIYRGAFGKAGGFVFDTKEGNPPSAGALAEKLRQAAAVLDPEGIFAFGGLLETDAGLAELDELLASAPPFCHAVVSDDTIYLSACAAAIAEYFYGE